MNTKRTYGDACGMARALDRVGERWALMVVRELLLGPKRFTDLRTGLPGVSADVLAQRLRELEESGIVERRRLPPPAATQVYDLTGWGRELGPVLRELGRWGARAQAPPPDAGMSIDAHALSLSTLFRSDLADDLSLRVALRLGDARYAVTVDGGTVAVRTGEPADAGLTITGTAGELLDVVHGRAALEDTGLSWTGDDALVRRFLTLFPLPAPAGPS